MIRILIADDHPIFRQGLIQIVEQCSDLTVTGEAGSGPDTLDLLRSGVYDVLILDISMPGMSGLEVLERMRSEQLELPVLILSMHSEDPFAARAFKLGAAGYVTKGTAPMALLEAIRNVVSGRRWDTPPSAER